MLFLLSGFMSEDIRESFLIEFDQFYETIKTEFAKAKEGKPTNNADVFRAFHTWKGNADLLSYSDFEQFSVKWTEHFRPKKDGTSLKDDVKFFEGIISELDSFRKTF